MIQHPQSHFVNVSCLFMTDCILLELSVGGWKEPLKLFSHDALWPHCTEAPASIWSLRQPVCQIQMTREMMMMASLYYSSGKVALNLILGKLHTYIHGLVPEHLIGFILLCYIYVAYWYPAQISCHGNSPADVSVLNRWTSWLWVLFVKKKTNWWWIWCCLLFAA